MDIQSLLCDDEPKDDKPTKAMLSPPPPPVSSHRPISQETLARRIAQLPDYALLPTEIRHKILRHSIEPQILILNDFLESPGGWPLPGTTQVNFESRLLCRDGYEVVGQKSYMHLSRDIVVCDEVKVHNVPEELALKIRRLVIWGCSTDVLHTRDEYEYDLARFFGRALLQKLDLHETLFPNMKSLWVVKFGNVDSVWASGRDVTALRQAQLKSAARHYRYWVADGIIETGELNLIDTETKLVVREGRCSEFCDGSNCVQHMFVSLVSFMDGKYEERQPSNKWRRITPAENEEAAKKDTEKARKEEIWREEEVLRWAMVEREVVTTLRWTSDDEDEPVSERRTANADDDLKD